MNLRSRILGKTVFNRLPSEPGHPNEILAILFHRLAFTSYALYTAYGLVAFLNGIPSIVSTLGGLGEYISSLFALLVVVTAAPAAYGALGFPRHARWELFSGAAFGSVLLIYTGILFAGGVGGTHANFAQLILILNIVALPTSRSVFIYLTLVRRANDSRSNEE